MSDAVIEVSLRDLALQDEQHQKNKQMLLEHEHFLRELALKQAALSVSASEPSGLDVVKNIRLVPFFVEKMLKSISLILNVWQPFQ